MTEKYLWGDVKFYILTVVAVVTQVRAFVKTQTVQVTQYLVLCINYTSIKFTLMTSHVRHLEDRSSEKTQNLLMPAP